MESHLDLTTGGARWTRREVEEDEDYNVDKENQARRRNTCKEGDMGRLRPSIICRSRTWVEDEVGD